MILKSYEINKIDLKKNLIILFYGRNEGAKKELLENIKSKFNIEKIIKYEEKEILNNKDILYDEMLSDSLFDTEKIILINSNTEKLLEDLDYISKKKFTNKNIIINAQLLDKKSKLRSFFEKSKDLISIPFYEDNFDTLASITQKYLKNKKINISPADINLIINRCGGDRGVLKNELEKIYLYSVGKKNLNTEKILKLTNLIENYDVSELIDSFLSRKLYKTMKILNENSYKNEDCILITKTLLNKTKRVLKLSQEYEKNQNLELTIRNAKPPIFWKDKEITKQQLQKLKPEHLKKLIFKVNEIELIIKRNLDNSLKVISDLLMDQSILKS